MEATHHPYADFPGEGKVARSWRLARTTWDLVRSDRTMLALAGLQLLFALLAGALLLYLGGYIDDPGQSGGHVALVSLISLYPMTFIGVFFGVALTAAAAAAMEGRHLSLRDALGVAVRRLDSIALWSLLTAGVGAILNEIASRIPAGGRFVAWLFGAAWTLGTIFVVPVLALEGAGPIQSLRRSAHLLKSGWGEGLVGSLTIAAWTFVISLPACFLLGAGGAVSNSSPNTAIVLIAIGLVLVLVASSVAATVRQVFAVALYRFAADGRADAFPRTDLESPFTRKRRWFGSKEAAGPDRAR